MQEDEMRCQEESCCLSGESVPLSGAIIDGDEECNFNI